VRAGRLPRHAVQTLSGLRTELRNMRGKIKTERIPC
jgi:hypothetical protein